MKKCKITVEKTYTVKGGELKSTHTIEIGENSLNTLCQHLGELVRDNPNVVVLNLYELLRIY